MGKPRAFTTMPARSIADTRLSALDLRVIAVISIHDGMSLHTGKGLGCYAKSSTLAELVRTDISNFSKSLSRLIKLGYVVREPQQNDKRRFTLRVVFGDDDSWRNDQVFGASERAEIVGETTNYSDGEIVGESANHSGKMVGETTNHLQQVLGETTNYLAPNIENQPSGKARKNRSSPHPEYIPLNGELHSVETGEINSAEAAQLADCDLRVAERDWSKSTGSGSIGRAKKNDAEASAARWVLTDHLPRNFNKLPDGAKLARFEEAFNAIDRDPTRMASLERSSFSELLCDISERHINENVAIANQASRLWEEVAPY